MKSFALLVLLLTASIVTAAPKVDSLFPAGGQRGTSVEITASGTFDSWPVQAWASHPGIAVAPGMQSGQLAIAIAADVPCGVHWVRLFDKTGASGLRPFLVNQVPEIQEKEPNDDFRKPQVVTQPSVIVNGRLGKQDDVDTFAVRLKKGEMLVAAVEAYRTLRSPMDAVLQILSVDGFVLAQNDDFLDTDPLIAFAAPKDGTYLVRLFCFAATPDSRVGFFGKETCIYRLTLTTGPYLDHVWPAAVERTNGGEVELSGWNVAADSRRFTVPPGATAERVFVQPPGFASGAWVRAEPHSVVRAGSGGAPLAAPVSIGGRLPQPGSRESLAFAAKKGERLSIRLESRELLLPLDSIVTIRDAAGKKLQTAQAAKLNGDPAFEFTAPADGPFAMEVRDLHDGGGPRYSFLVRIRLTTPDFDASVVADHFTGTADQPIDLPISIALRNGLKGPLEFRVEGLPDSARAEFVPGGETAPAPPKKGKNAKKGPRATAVVRLHGLAAPINAPFRLYALAPGQEETKREVPAVLIDLSAAVPFLWLTVTDSAK